MKAVSMWEALANESDDGQDRFGHDGLGHDRLGHDGVGGHEGLDRFGWVVLVCIWTFGPR